MDWITSVELVEFLIAHPDVEYECRMRIGGGIVSTHWWFFDSENRCFQHLRDIKYSSVNQRELLLYYKDCMWRIEQ